ncbi:MAG: hypothetical protein H2069_08590 [Legionella sp.]|nr:hypothetical protein [Legionella sp.]
MKRKRLGRFNLVSNKIYRKRRLKISYQISAGILGLISQGAVFSQFCPSSIAVVDATCAIITGTTVTVSTANATGLHASGPLGAILANGNVENLGALGDTGVLAQSGSAIFFNNSTLEATAITAAGAPQSLQ